jgi:glutamine---fructose-6-phosphate transaminase (isomerizing)
MCGIFSYIGDNLCRGIILNGLSRLEYRGYDSAGIACLDAQHGHLSYLKKAGGVKELKRLAAKAVFDGYSGIGHTRWATHGVIDSTNAHPHFNCDKSIAIVHNGIIEGFEHIKKKLIDDGHEFVSTTDTEVVVHLFSDILNRSLSIIDAVVELTNTLSGAYSIAILMEKHPDQLLVIRKKSPFVIGIGINEMFVASDFLAFSDITRKVLFMPDNSFALMKKNSLNLYDFKKNKLSYTTENVDKTFEHNGKEGFKHYMLKEIYEQKRAITRTISFCKKVENNNIVSKKEKFEDYAENVSREYNDGIWYQLGIKSKTIKNIRHLNLVAAGTSWHATRIAQFFFEELCKISTRVYLSSEFQYMNFFPEKDSLFIFVSQSGETADTLQSLRLVNFYNIPTVAITNIASSMIVREAGGFLPMQAGPEIAVASTKAFSTQVATLYWLANRIALERDIISLDQMHQAEEDLFITAEILEISIESYKLKITQSLAKKYAKYERFIFLGRHISYPFALEASLKLKEISYIFSQCYPAGELKHGPIALVDEKTPVVIFSLLNEQVYWKLVLNAQEIKARKGHLVVFAFEGQTELIDLADTAFVIPRVKHMLAPLAMTGIMQFFVYKITCELNRPIDKPRNLAKAVTVE